MEPQTKILLKPGELYLTLVGEVVGPIEFEGGHIGCEQKPWFYGLNGHIPGLSKKHPDTIVKVYRQDDEPVHSPAYLGEWEDAE